MIEKRRSIFRHLDSKPGMRHDNNPLLSRAVAKLVLGLCIIMMQLVSTTSYAFNSNKWRIEVSEGANSAGVISFLVAEKHAVPITVTVSIRDGLSENFVARAIRDGFRQRLPADRFKVELDDGEDVLVKKRWGANRFKLKLLESTPRGVRINIDRE